MGGNSSTGPLPSLPAELKSRASSLPAVGEGKWEKKRRRGRRREGKGDRRERGHAGKERRINYRKGRESNIQVAQKRWVEHTTIPSG